MPKPNLSKDTVRKLRLIQKCILAEPELYDQTEFPRVGQKCTTPCCIEGWAAWVNNPNKRAYEARLARRRFEISEELGVTEKQRDLLFSEWPDKFQVAWEKPGTIAAAKAGAARIEHFIQTGK